MLMLKTSLRLFASLLVAVLVTAGAYALVPAGTAEAQCGGYNLVCTSGGIGGSPMGAGGQTSSPTNGCLTGEGYVEQINDCGGSNGGGGGGGGGTSNPYAIISASPSTIPAGESTTLSWGSDSVSSCSINQSVGSVAPNTFDSRLVAPSVTTTYTISCATSANGTVTSSATVSVIPAEQLPDLVGQVGGAATASVNQPVTLYGGVANQGEGNANYFPNTIQVCDTDCATVNQKLEATPISSLVAGGWKQVAATYTPTSQGSQFYRVCANLNTGWTNVHSESQYTNNCSGWQTLGVITPIPDLTVGSVSPDTASMGQTRTLSATVTNLGSYQAGANQAYVQVTAPSSKNSLTTTVAVPAIAAGSASNVTFSYKFTSAGTYSARVCADWNGQVAESNEDNNCGPWSPISVADTPMATGVSCTVNPSSAAVGQSVTYTAIPSGSASAPYSWTGSDGATGFGSDGTAVRTFTGTGTYGMQVSATNVSGATQCPVVAVSEGGCSGATTNLTISATPNRVRAGQAVTVTWNATGVNGAGASCTVSGPGVAWTSAVSPAPVCDAGGSATATISSQSTYTITCAGQSRSTTVNVVPNIIEN